MSEPISNAFSQMLGQLRGGQPLTELTEAMQNCVAAAKEHQKPATLKLTLKFSPQGGAMIVTDDIDLKLPEKERTGSIFFPTELNTLSRENPEQRNLDLQTVETPRPEMQEVTAVKAI